MRLIGTNYDILNLIEARTLLKSTKDIVREF